MSQEFLVQNLWLIAVVIVSGLLLLWPVLTKAGGTRVSVHQAILLLNQRKAVLVDIRDEKSVQNEGLVPNSKRMLTDELKSKASLLAKSKNIPLIILSQAGTSIGSATVALKAAGYTDVFVLEGGINAWKEAGMPIKKAQQHSDDSLKTTVVKLAAKTDSKEHKEPV